MHRGELVVRTLYEARSARDFDTVGRLLAEDVIWREPGSESYSGTHRGREAVMALLSRLDAHTGGSFRLRLREAFTSHGHVFCLIDWEARREGRHLKGREGAVYRVAEGRVVSAEFYPEDPDDPEAWRAFWSW